MADSEEPRETTHTEAEEAAAVREAVGRIEGSRGVNEVAAKKRGKLLCDRLRQARRRVLWESGKVGWGFVANVEQEVRERLSDAVSPGIVYDWANRI